MSVAETLGQAYREQDRRHRYYPGLHLESQPGVSETDVDHGSKPRIDENHRGMAYGGNDYDRGHPHPRPMQDPFRDRGNEDLEKFQKQKQDMEQDIQRMKERQMKEKMEREDEKKKNYEMLTQQFPWDKNKGHGAPRKRETDLFLDTLGGPGGTVVRENGSPSLTDPRFHQQQQQFQQFQNQTPRMSPYELQEYSQKLEHISEEKRMAKQQRRMQDLRQQIDGYKSEPNADRGYRPDFSMDRRPGSNRHPRRSLDLDTSKGGAGAPVKDDRGKNMTRRPITLSRDDYGESKIREDIPGKGNFDISFSDEDGRPYYPWGGQGGGAPIRDRQGNVVTQIYGKLEGRDSESAEIRRARRRQEVLYNELKEGERQHKQSKDEFNRYLKAPQADVADVLLAGRVGKPKRDAITGEIGQQHLGNSDVSKLKMNYQEKPVSEKRQLHEDLVRAADERKQARELEKLKEKQESNAHFNNMDRQWGAFGGGAPKHSQIRKKANLTNALFYPDASPITGPKLMMFNPPTGLGSFEQSPIPSYQKLYVDGDSRQYPPTDSTPRFVKSTLNSSHKNMFDANPESRLARGNSVEPPYATGGIY